jgi:peptidoglycan/LPS O-acetylase OafA/YrhL
MNQRKRKKHGRSALSRPIRALQKGGNEKFDNNMNYPTQLNRLTALRFFAALLVVLHHTLPNWAHYALTYKIAQFGDLGVTFFFILSGFVLTWAHQMKNNTLKISSFLKLRFARIYPLHLIFVFIPGAAFFILGINLAGYPNKSLLSAVSQVFLVHGWIPLHPNIRQNLNGVSWTLSLEFFFYILFMPIYRKLKSKSKFNLIALCLTLYTFYGLLILISMKMHSENIKDLIWFYPLFRLPEFIYGMVLAILIRRQNEKLTSVNPFLPIILLVFVISIYAKFVINTERFAAEYNFFLIPFFLCIIYAFAYRDIWGNPGLLNNNVLVRLGQESYALYISHAVFLGIFSYSINKIGVNLQNPLAGEILTVTFVMSSITLASIAHSFLEIPCQSFLKKRLN